MQEVDEIDRANDLAQRERDFALAKVRARLAEAPVPTGRCLHCDDIMDDERRWCSVSCRDEWEREQAGRARNGQ